MSETEEPITKRRNQKCGTLSGASVWLWFRHFTLTSEVARAKDRGLFRGECSLPFYSLFEEMRGSGYAHLWLLVCLISGVTRANGDVALTHRASPLKPSESKSSLNHSEHGHDSIITGIPIVTFKWHHVEAPYIIVLWILVAGLGKMGT